MQAEEGETLDHYSALPIGEGHNRCYCFPRASDFPYGIRRDVVEPKSPPSSPRIFILAPTSTYRRESSNGRSYWNGTGLTYTSRVLQSTQLLPLEIRLCHFCKIVDWPAPTPGRESACSCLSSSDRQNYRAVYLLSRVLVVNAL